MPDAQIASALGVLASSGQVGFDLAAARFHRPLPVQAGLLDTLHPRLAEARKLVAGGGCGAKARGSTRCNRRSSATGSRWAPSPRKTVAPALARQYQGTRGPCKHTLAVRMFLDPLNALEPEHDLEPDRTPRGARPPAAATRRISRRSRARWTARTRTSAPRWPRPPPSRLFNAEGRRPGLALCWPHWVSKLVAETLAPADMERKREYGARHGEMTPAVIEAAAGRTQRAPRSSSC